MRTRRIVSLVIVIFFVLAVYWYWAYLPIERGGLNDWQSIIAFLIATIGMGFAWTNLCLDVIGWVNKEDNYFFTARKNLIHWSDCAIYNAPAFQPMSCDCGAVKAHKRWWTYLYHLSCIHVSHLRDVLHGRLRDLTSKILR